MRMIASALAVACAGAPAHAQNTLDWPVSEFRPQAVDSGLRANPGAAARTVFTDAVAVKEADWLRLSFPGTELDAGSFIRVTSLLDGQVQELDARALAMWGNTSAYFNGSEVLVELVAAPGSARNRLSIAQVEVPLAGAQPVGGGGQCGICGTDDRVPSSELWAARLMPAGCTASVFEPGSCMVSAGHCIGGSMVVEFNVPPSNSNCSINHPPVADQFPIVGSDSISGGVGNDWAVLAPGTNNVGQLPYDRYSQLRPIAAAPATQGQAANIWGYGVDLTCVNSQVQQTSGGSITFVGGTYYEYDVDVRGGNSGSALMRGGEIVAIVTHCDYGCPNYGTRVDLPAFAASRAICGEWAPDCPAPGDCCVAHDNTGCDDQDCCEAICSIDPYCCSGLWDQICVNEAEAEPACDQGQCAAPGPGEAALVSFAIVQGTQAGGNLASLDHSDDDRLQVAAKVSGNKYLTIVDVNLQSPLTTVMTLTLTTEVGLNQNVSNLKTKVQVRNWNNNSWANVATYTQSAADDSNDYTLTNPNNFVRDSDGLISVRITTTASAGSGGYTARIDHVQVVATPPPAPGPDAALP